MYLLTLTAALLSLAAAAAAQAPGLNDLVGARAPGAEQEMQRRGYVNTGGSQGDDRTYTYWYHSGLNRCVTVATRNGRYDSVTPSPVPDCRRQTRPPVPANPPYPPQPGYPGGAGGRPDFPGMDLTLVCYGEGRAPTTRSYTSYEWSDRHDRYVRRSNNYVGTQEFDSDLQIDIINGRGRIHLTGQLKPVINNGGLGGNWWELRDLVIAPDRITARYRLNGLNQPRVTVNRRTGRIRIDGPTSFTGTCDAGDFNNGRHRF